MTKQSMLESVEDAFESVGAERINEELGIIKGVKLLGLVSKNKRTYDTPGVRRTAVKMLEGAPIFLDHPSMQDVRKPRSYRDKFAHVIQGTVTYSDGKGYFGDIRYNKAHSVAAQFVEDVKHAPSTLGFSINGDFKSGGTDSNGVVVVEELLTLRSVDLVTTPATTAGVFEHFEEETDMSLTLEELKTKYPDLYKQALESAQGDLDASKTAAALEAEQKKSKELADRLAAIEAKQAEDARVAGVRKDVVAAFEGVELPKEVLDLAVECACQMKETEKFKDFASKLSPLLKEVPDSEEDETSADPVGRESHEDKGEGDAALESKGGYTPGGRKQKKGSCDLMSALGLPKK